MYSIAHGNTKEHAAALALGLKALGATFFAEVCGLCGGLGEYEQVYTAGCGMGSYRTIGGCDVCDATGLTQGHKPAPRSVLNQVIEASKRGAA